MRPAQSLFLPFPRPLLLALFLDALLFAGCKGPATVTPTVDPARSTVTVSPATGVRADGYARATVSITLLSTTGTPISGATVLLSATGDRDFLVQPPETDAYGRTAGTIASTAAGTKTITASVSSVALDQTPKVQFVAGPATQLVFATEPGNVAAGALFSPQIQVAFEDIQGNVALSTDAVTLTLANGTAGATLGGTLTVPAVAGVATFPDLNVTTAGTGYTIQATAGSFPATDSTPFNVAAAAEAKLAFAVQPSNALAATPIAPPVGVVVQDQFGNIVPSAVDLITVAVATGPTGATLSGTLSHNAVEGQASFADLSLAKAGPGYSLAASAPGLHSTTSASFTISPAARSQLVFIVEPSAVQAGSTVGPPVQVAFEDASGNVVSSTDDITVAIATGPSGVPLLGTTTVGAAGGISTFADLALDTPGTYSLSATSGSFTTTSTPFVVSSGPPSHLVFSTQPSNAVAGAVIAPPVQVTLEDALGNTVPDSTTAVTVAIGTHPAAGTLAGTSTETAVNGVATFPNLSIDAAGTGYTLAATANAYAGATSGEFNIAVGVPATGTSTVSANPTSVTADGSSKTQLTVTAMDAYGNTVSGVSVTLQVSGSANTLGLTGGTTNVSGTFTTSLESTKAETKEVTATIGGVATATTSVTFVASSPVEDNSTLTVTPPSVPVDGSSVATVTTLVEDANGNPVPNTPVSLACTGTGNTLMPTSGLTGADGKLSATLISTKAETKTVSAIVGSFTLTAPVTFVPGAVSGTTSTVSASPEGTVADGATPMTITVTALDLDGNPIAGQSVSLGVSGSGNTLGDTSGETDATGTFTTTLTSTMAGTKTVTATLGSVRVQTQATFVAGAPDPTNSTVTANPPSATADGTTSILLTVAAVDANGNPVDQQPVSLAVSGTGNTLASASGTTDAEGVFQTTLTSTAAGQKTVTATIGSVAPTTTVIFTPGAPSTLTSTVTVTPPSVIADGSSLGQILVTVEDPEGNPVPDQSLTLSASGSANTLSVTSGTTDQNGQVTATLSSTKAEVKTITATLSAGPVSGQVTFVAGAPIYANSSLTISPNPVNADGTTTTTITVALVDTNGNPVSTSVDLTVSGSGNTLTPAEGSSVGGVFTASLSSTVGEVKVVTATAGSLILTANAVFIPRYAVTGWLGTLGTRPAPVNNMQIVDDGLEYQPQSCTGNYCVTGGIVP